MAKHTLNILRCAITKERVNQITGNKTSIRCFEIELLIVSYMMLYAVWYHFYNSKNRKNTHGGVLIFKSNTPPWVFSRFSNCTKGNKLRKASHV